MYKSFYKIIAPKVQAAIDNRIRKKHTNDMPPFTV